MSHMLTASGAEYFFLGHMATVPEGQPVYLLDIAHQLAIINRFHGATRRPYSVAEHSLLVSEIAERDGQPHIVQLAALMHDAHEIYTNDLASPAKEAANNAVGPTDAWRRFESRHATRVRMTFGLLTAFAGYRAQLRHYDLQALATERRDLLPWEPTKHEEWVVLRDGQADAITAIDWITLNGPERAGMDWTEWRDRFLDRFDELQEALRIDQGLE